MDRFVHLHNHSYYSLMDGLNSPDEIVERAVKIGQPGVAITDHGKLPAHRELYRAAKKAGIKPIFGLEAYISSTTLDDRRSAAKRDDGTQTYNHIILLAKNDVGYKNINQLSQIAWTQGFYSKPRIDRAVLAQHKEGIIVLSGCLNGLISKAIERGDLQEADTLTRWFKTTFDGDFYMEVQEHNPGPINRELIRLADKHGVTPIATGDCHYADPKHGLYEEAMLILSTSPKLSKEATFEGSKKIENLYERLNYLYPERKMTFQEYGLYMHTREDLEERFANSEYPLTRSDIFDATMEVFDKIEGYSYFEGLDLLPVPSTGNPDELLEKKALQGLKRRGLHESEQYLDRLNEELKIIRDKGFSTYFLIEANAIDWAKGKSIRIGPGRGSGAGSLVNYALGITNVDPIVHKLLFFRFINPERNDFPDIDTDVQDSRRGEVKDYHRRKFVNVASIATYNKFQGKNSVRDASRVWMVPLGDVNKALKGADYPPNADFFSLWLDTPNGFEFAQKYPEVIDLAKFLHGRIRGQGMHAGGIVVSNRPISDYAPMESAKDPNDESGDRIPLVALDMVEAEKVGLIKYDWLGLKTLSVIQDTIDLIKSRRGVKVDIDSVPMDDPKVYNLLNEGYTKGVFQVEAPTYTNLIFTMGGVHSFEELTASNALVRPGAADSSAGEAFIKRKNGNMKVEFHHPLMEDFTKDTYGAIIYQEQVMLTLTTLAGMKMSTADKVRKIIGKKKDVSELEQYRAEFMEGAAEHVEQEVAEGLWHDFEAHANYSFNKSHAVAYSMLSYQTAWLKAHYPLEFMTAILRNEKDKDTRLEYLTEAKRMGLKIMLPHINASGLNFEIQRGSEGEYIRMGLSNVKYISDKVGTKIVEARPFRDYAHFLEVSGTKGSGINKRAVDALNAIGGAAFTDNPRNGNERENLYEYLSIPAFETKGLPPKVRAQMRPLTEYAPDESFVVTAMVRSIKRGPGWARLDIVDEVGSAGVFTEENSPIETGKMYVLLIANNRVSRFIAVDSYDELPTMHTFKRYLERDVLWEVDEGSFLVLQFKTRKTKAGRLMADAVFATQDKKLWAAMVWPGKYQQAFKKCTEGAVVKVELDLTDDGARFVKSV